MGREVALERQRERRKADGNASTRKYEKTVNGFLVRAYRNMKSRIVGVQKVKHHLYDGKTLLSKEDFYTWAKASSEFQALFTAWEASDYDRKLTPSVDRVDSLRGYELDNMQWVTHSINSSRGAKNKQRRLV